MDWAPLLLSLKIALLATVATTIVGVALAALLAWPRCPARDLLDAIISTPMVLPPTVLGYYLLVTLGRTSAIGGWYEDVTGRSIVFTTTGAVIAAAVGSLPLVVKPARAALEWVDPTLRAAARTLGARPLRVFFTITLPLAAPGIFAGVMLGFARALGDFGATLMVVGSRLDGTQPVSIHIYDALQAGREGDAAVSAAVTTVVAIGLLWWANRASRRYRVR